MRVTSATGTGNRITQCRSYVHLNTTTLSATFHSIVVLLSIHPHRSLPPHCCGIMSKPVVLVLGTNGYVGKATVKSLSDTYADKVVIKAASRDPAKLGELRDLKGVELVALDMSAPDAASHIKATGAATVYVVTPGVENRAAITINAANASKEASVGHLVVVSAITTDVKDTVFGRQLTEIESHVKKLGLPYTLLRLPLFVDNFWADAETIKKQSTSTVQYSVLEPRILILQNIEYIKLVFYLFDRSARTNFADGRVFQIILNFNFKTYAFEPNLFPCDFEEFSLY